MQHGLSVVADLTGGDAEMQRAVQEVIKAFGGLDIIVNRHFQPSPIYAACPSAVACLPHLSLKPNTPFIGCIACVSSEPGDNSTAVVFSAM